MTLDLVVAASDGVSSSSWSLITRAELAQAVAEAADAAEIILGCFFVFGALVVAAVCMAALIVRAFEAFEGPSK